MLKKAQRGDTGDTSVVLADIRSFLNHVAAATKNATEGQSTPLFLMGHSMGGGEVLLLSLLKQQPHAVPPMSGLLLESPFIDFDPAAKPDGFTVFAGKLASKVLPKHHMVQKLEPKNICRDPEVCRNWEADELCHDTGTLEGLAALVQRSADLTALATGKPVEGLGLTPVLGPEPVAVWIGHGTGDLVTSCPRSQSMFDKLQAKDKTLKLYEGAYHVLHAEPNGVAEEYTDDVANWILGRTEAGREGKEDSNDIRPKL